jgi:hypothetical protein
MGCLTREILSHHEEPTPPSRHQSSEYLPQRRKGRKEIKLPALAFLASWREQIPVLDNHGPAENLRKL